MRFKRLLTLFAVFWVSLLTGVMAHAAPRVTIRAELASPIVLENTQDANYLKVSLQGLPLEAGKRSPINLALVIDRSSSMSGDRIARARDAAIMAVNMLQSDDILSIVAYDSSVEVVVPATRVQDKRQLIALINERITPRGMTALFAGLSKGVDETSRFLDKERINHVILLSDGQANVGPTSIRELSELARIAAAKGITITTVGIGEGYNEDLMTAIAGYSDGNHFFVQHVAQLEGVFAKEFQDVMSVVAQDVDVTIHIAHGVKPVRLLGREGQIDGNTVTVRLNQLYADQEKYVLLEVLPAKGAADQKLDLAQVDVKYNDLSAKRYENQQQNVRIAYSSSAAAVKAAVVEDVMVEAAVQQSTLDNERAIQLIDLGRVDEAKAIMLINADKFDVMSPQLNSEQARERLRLTYLNNSCMLDMLRSGDDINTRKALSESNYQLRNQQGGISK